MDIVNDELLDELVWRGLINDLTQRHGCVVCGNVVHFVWNQMLSCITPITIVDLLVKEE